MSKDNAMVLTPAELKAIEEHKYYMSLEQGKEIPIERAIRDFMDKHRPSWLQEKQRGDNYEQLEEIQRYKWIRSEQEGHDIGKKVASEEWIVQNARVWRREKESLEAKGFTVFRFIVQDCQDLEREAVARLAEISLKHHCTIYLHKEGMLPCSFILDGKGYVDVRSDIAALLRLELWDGKDIELILGGENARKALDEIRLRVAKGDG